MTRFFLGNLGFRLLFIITYLLTFLLPSGLAEPALRWAFLLVLGWALLLVLGWALSVPSPAPPPPASASSIAAVSPPVAVDPPRRCCGGRRIVSGVAPRSLKSADERWI